MKAIILAAGKGTRLKPLTEKTPKPLLKIKDKTILEHIIISLPDSIEDIYIVADYLIEQMEDFVKTVQIKKNIYIIKQISAHTGTMAALLSVKPYIGKDERFLVLNGDDLQEKEELGKYLEYKRAFGVQHAHIPYFAIEIENGLVKGFRPQTEEEKNGLGAKIATGTYVLDYEIFNTEPILLSDGSIGLPQTILATQNYPINSVETKNWKQINTLEDYNKVLKEFEI